MIRIYNDSTGSVDSFNFEKSQTHSTSQLDQWWVFLQDKNTAQALPMHENLPFARHHRHQRPTQIPNRTTPEPVAKKPMMCHRCTELASLDASLIVG